jgi:hypothetical protein
MDWRAIGIAGSLALSAAVGAWLLWAEVGPRPTSASGGTPTPIVSERPRPLVPPQERRADSERRELLAAAESEDARDGGGSAPDTALDLAGHVRFPDGTPAPGARVLAFRATDAGDFGVREDLLVRALEDGTFALRGLEPGAYLLRAAADGACPSEGLRVELQVGAPRAPIELWLRAGGSIRALVLGLDGQPAPARTVRIAGPWIEGARVAETDGRGQLELEHLPPGEWTLRTWPDDAELGAAGVRGSFEKRFEHEDARTLALADGGHLEVVLGSRSPLAVWVSGQLRDGASGVHGFVAWHFAGDDPHVRPRAVETDPEGRYAVELDAPGSWLVCVQRAQQGSAVHNLATGVTYPARRHVAVPTWMPIELNGAGHQGVDLTLPSGRLIGQVVDELTGRPVPTHVGLRRELSAPSAEARAFEQWTDSEGRFEFIDVEPGRWSLDVFGLTWQRSQVDAAGIPATVVLDGIEVGPGPRELLVELPRGQRIAGRVRDAQGEPAQFAQLFAWDSRGRTLWTGEEAMAGADGAFWLPGLTPGDYSVMAVFRELVSEPAAVHVEPGSAGVSPAELELTVARGAFVELDLPTSRAARLRLESVRDAAGRDLSSLARRDARSPAQASSLLRIGPLPGGELTLVLLGLADAPRELRVHLDAGELRRLAPDRDF